MRVELAITQVMKMQTSQNNDAIVSKFQLTLEKLKSGQVDRRKTKSQTLSLIKPELVSLIKQGFTRAQIIEAFSNDGFKIIPRTLIEVLGTDMKQKRKPAKRKAPAATPAASTGEVKPVTPKPVKPASVPVQQTTQAKREAIAKITQSAMPEANVKKYSSSFQIPNHDDSIFGD